MTPPYEDEPDKYKSKQCWDSIFTYFLLSEGFKFDKDNWNVEYIHKVQFLELLTTKEFSPKRSNVMKLIAG